MQDSQNTGRSSRLGKSVCGGVTAGEPLDRICSFLSQMAPLRLAEDWDNVGLLLGDRAAKVSRAMTCLTITPDVVDEAIASKADLIIAHHPLPFKPVSKITSDTPGGQILWKLSKAGIAVYSAHTAYDSASQGINQQWAESLGLNQIEPLIPLISPSGPLSAGQASATVQGSGRLGRFDAHVSLGRVIEEVQRLVPEASIRLVDPNHAGKSGAEDPAECADTIKKLGVACGSGGSFLSAAKRKGCQALVTGEATFHTCLEARTLGIALILVGHYWSERFAMEKLADRLSEDLTETQFWASRCERDPISCA